MVPSRRYRAYQRDQRKSGVPNRIIRIVLLIFLSYVVVDSLFLKSYKIGSGSMLPTLSVGDRVLASPAAYGVRLPFGSAMLPGFRPVKRGDIVLVRPGYFSQTVWQELMSPFVSFFSLQRKEPNSESSGAYTTSMTVKRVVALPGDTIKIVDNTVLIRPGNGTKFTEEFALSESEYRVNYPEYPDGWSKNLPFSGSHDELVLGDRQFFVVSDDRSSAHDSRFWGAVDESYIVSKIILRYWPFNVFGSL